MFADIDPVTYCLDAVGCRGRRDIRGPWPSIVVHRFGRSADIAALRQVGQRHGLLVLEQGESGDAVQRAGVERRQRAAYLSAKLKGVRTSRRRCDGHTFQQYVVRVPGNGRPDRDAFARAVRAKGVECQRAGEDAACTGCPAFRRDVCLPRDRAGRRRDAGAAHRSATMSPSGTLQRLVSACNALGGLLQPAF